MSSHFLMLPTELQRMILDRVLHPADLKALCRVSKHVSELATECLYRDLILPHEETDRKWEKLQRLLQSRGLEYVRTVDVGASHCSEYTFCKPLGEIISNLPSHTLTRFHFGPLGRPTSEGLKHLWRNQHNLTNLQLDFSLNAPSIAELVREDAVAIRSLKSVTELELNLFTSLSYASEDYARLIDLVTFPELEKLEMCYREDTETKWGPLLMERLWTRLLPASLTSITLSYLSLPTTKVLELDGCPSLKHLQVKECLQLYTILDSFRRPSLVSLVVRLEQWDQTSENVAAVTRFLSRFGSLHRLIIDADNDCWRWSEREIEDLTVSITNHREGLQSLLINIMPEHSPSVKFTCLLLGCQSLRQLAVHADGRPLLDQCQALICQLPRLATLNIFKLSCSNIEEGVELAAKKAFASTPRSARLSLVVFGEDYRYGDWLDRYSHENRPVRYCFFRDRSTSTVTDENSGSAPRRIKTSQAKFVESESEVLDYALNYWP